MTAQSYFKVITVLLLSTLLISCGSEEPTTLAPHTGDPKTEITEVNPEIDDEVLWDTQLSPQVGTPETKLKLYGNGNPTASLSLNQTLYIHASKLNVRSGPNTSFPSLGMLDLNDEVQPVSGLLIESAGYNFIEINILKTNSIIEDAESYFVPYEYLSSKKQTARAQSISRYFMIQNIATEKLRIYEKGCNSGNCAHKLILEASIAVGEDSKKENRRTVAGHFRVNSWTKFYQDGAGLYPSWYDPNYPAVPKPGASTLSWTKKKVLPYKKAVARGAFGWYTAKISPDSHSQWTHGTLGWGSDKKKYINATRKFFANLITDPRSHGCSRTDNETIAYLRELLPVGSTVLKVYAKEATANQDSFDYSQQSKNWNYILTKNGVRVDGQKSDREKVLAAGTPKSQWLEEGHYQADTHPDAHSFRAGKRGAKKGKNGNVYALEESQMKGVFLVNEGRLVNYDHPSSPKVAVGGYKDQRYPHFVISKNTDYTLPKKR